MFLSATVIVAELITGVNIALGTTPLATCSAFDCRGAHQVTIDCLTRAVQAAIEGCGPASRGSRVESRKAGEG